MIIREVIQILDQTIYRNYSDQGHYIKNKTTGLVYTDVNSTIDYEYEELDESPQLSDQEIFDILIGRHE